MRSSFPTADRPAQPVLLVLTSTFTATITGGTRRFAGATGVSWLREDLANSRLPRGCHGVLIFSGAGTAKHLAVDMTVSSAALNQAGDLTNAQFPIPIRRSLRMRIENWELRSAA